MDKQLREAALQYHRQAPAGKISVNATKPMITQRDLALAYSPGVAAACELIVENPAEVRNMTSRGNLVAVITNGTAVLGLGAIGPLAAKPVMEGKGVLFKKFAGIDVFDIEIFENDLNPVFKLIDLDHMAVGGGSNHKTPRDGKTCLSHFTQISAFTSNSVHIVFVDFVKPQYIFGSRHTFSVRGILKLVKTCKVRPCRVLICQRKIALRYTNLVVIIIFIIVA